ncbi:hypothetical protein E2P81_ATG06091 [Venturia nashicola]|uniref:Uncharacterized protein n=1 Tax=Venturia nashicola TaxID=86259 RepID=A0A4Z1NST9_9PEZI|nr:hypothetical protein E6O75_ATG06233 [Venturia nashicola]TLD29797.1 hypothetical protein E2P81_ATG06091 [Venturia nashicola]
MIGNINRWYLNLRLDTDPRFTPAQITAAFTACEELEVEVWQAEYGTSNLNSLRMFEGIRQVKRAKIVGNVSEEYKAWLENCMRAEEGAFVQDFKGSMGVAPWRGGNR